MPIHRYKRHRTGASNRQIQDVLRELEQLLDHSESPSSDRLPLHISCIVRWPIDTPLTKAILARA